MGSGLNFLDLILEASLLVQLVMLGLVAMSVMSWAIIFQRKKAISDALDNVKKFEQKFWSGIDLSKLYNEISSRSGNHKVLKDSLLQALKSLHATRKTRFKARVL